MSEEILQPNQPAKFEARNMRPRFKRLRSGDIFLAEIEIDEAVWNQLRTVPENALLEVVLWHHDGDGSGEPVVMETKPEKSAKEEKGSHGQYWNKLRTWPIWTFPDLCEVLDSPADGDAVWESLHVRLGTRSLTFISPDEFEKWLSENALDAVVSVSRQVRAKLENGY